MGSGNELPRLDIKSFDGLLLPFKITDLEMFRKARKYQPSKGDIVIATYPKSGEPINEVSNFFFPC